MAHDQLVVGHGQHVSGQQDAAHGDLPVVGAPVDVDADGLVAVGAGEADLIVQGVLELDITQAQGLVLPAELAQTLEVELQLPLLPAPGEGAAAEGIAVARLRCLQRFQG